MKVEVPLCSRCCFCIPLRYGLLVWGYLVLLLDTLLLITDGYAIHFIAKFIEHYSVFELIRFLSALFGKIFNFALTLLLIIASHKKNSRLMKIYYTFALVGVGLNAVLIFTSIVFDVVTYWSYLFIWKFLLFRIVFDLTTIVLQLYFIALVRSEITKLDNSSMFEFRNIAAEAECGYYGPNDGRVTLNNENSDAAVKKENNEDGASDTVKTKTKSFNKVLLNSGLNLVVNKNVGYDTVGDEE